MEYIIITLLVILIIISIINLLKNNDANIIEKLGNNDKNLTKEIGEFKLKFTNDLRNDFEKLNESIERKLLEINDRVNERIDNNFEKTNKTFNNLLERISKIDEAQKKIDTLSSEIISLQSVLTDKKTRGIFGEVNLNYILSNIFGDKKTIYNTQYKMPNSANIVDAILFAPEPLGTIAIDSKFPLENYRRMTDKAYSQAERDIASKMFKSDVKKHIDAIATKYIVEGFTADEAIMFLPAEAIFAELNAYHPDLIEYSFQKKVWIASPTTLMSTLSTIAIILKNVERDKYAQVIHTELIKLSTEFKRYKERWDKLSRSIDTVTNDIKDIHITTGKITEKFESINNVDLNIIEDSQKKMIE